MGEYAFDAEGAPPELPAPQDCVGVPVGSFGLATIAERIEFRSAALPGWFRGEPTGRPSSEFWVRFADGRDADLLSLPLLVDSTAPSVLELGAGSTTIQLTVHLRARPAPRLAGLPGRDQVRERRLPRGRLRGLGLGGHAGGPVPAAGHGPAAVRASWPAAARGRAG